MGNARHKGQKRAAKREQRRIRNRELCRETGQKNRADEQHKNKDEKIQRSSALRS